VVLAGLFVGYAGLAGVVPPLDDELYYWCWSKDLQLSYYDHPPMTALMIRASTAVFGDTLFAVRLPACVATVVVLGVVGWLTRPRRILLGTVFTPVFTFGAVVVTPDTPLLLFWSLYLAWLVVVHQRLTPDDGAPPSRIPGWLWAVGGGLLGCGILGKYTTGLAVPAGFLSFVLLGFGAVRRWAVGYAVHLVVGFVVASPILIHNIREGFAPLLYQWGHATASDGPGWKAAGEFVGVQVLLVGTLPLVLLPWMLWRWRTLAADPRLRVCLCLYGLPIGVFLLKSFGGKLEGNWALASYLAFWPIAARWYACIAEMNWKWRWMWRWGGRLSFAAPAVCTAALGAHLAHPLPIVSPNDDKVSRQPERFAMLKAAAEFVERRADGYPVFTDTYQTAAVLRFHGLPAKQEEGVHRPSHFTQRPERMRDFPAAYYLSNGPIERKENDAGVAGAFADHVAGFDRPELVAVFPLSVRGHRYDSYKLWFYRRPTARHAELAGGSARLPPPAPGVYSFRP
jgi:hypothetical protein